MVIHFSNAAKEELNDACEWFQAQQSGLGSRFRGEVRKATLQIAQSPLLFPIELGEVRRYVMTSFPYTLRYSLQGNEVWIMTVSHQHRRPDYWVDRVENQ